MIRVTYYPINSVERNEEATCLHDWIVANFPPPIRLPQGLHITLDSVSAECDVTDDISNGDPDGHLHATTGHYHLIEVPASNVPVLGIGVKLLGKFFSWLTPSTSVSAASSNSSDTSSSNALGDRSNDARPGERFQDVRGWEPCIYGDLLMEPHRRYVDEEECEFIYCTATMGHGLIDNPRDGTTPLQNLPGAQFNVYGPYTSPNSGDAPEYSLRGTIDYPVVAARKSSNVTGDELVAPNELSSSSARFRADSTGLITITNPDDDLDLTAKYQIGDVVQLSNWYAWQFAEYVGIGSGTSFTQVPVYNRINLSGNYVVTSVGLTSFTVNIAAQPNWAIYGSGFTLPTVAYRYKNDTSKWTTDSDVYNDYESYFDAINVTPTADGLYNGTVGPFRLPDNCASGWVNLLANNGIYKAGEDNVRYSVTCQFTLYEVTSDGTRTGNKTVLSAITLSSNSTLITDYVGKTQDFTVPYYYCEIEGRRTSNTDKDFEGSVIDDVQWQSLYTVENGVELGDVGDVTTVYAKIVRNPRSLSVETRKLNFGVTRYERSYLGNGAMSTTLDTPSDEFADAVVGLALDPWVGKTVTLDQLNVDSLYAVQEEIATYFGTRQAVKFGYSFDSTDITFEDHLNTIATAVFCRVFRIGNTYEFRFDRPRAIGERAMLLNHRVKYAGTDKRTRRFNDVDGKGYDGVIITYKDYKSFAQETITLPVGSDPTNALEITLDGVIYPQVATWYAYRQWNKILYQRRYHQAVCHSLARGLVPGDRIVMANDTVTRPLNGEVLQQSGLHLRLSDNVVIESDIVYSITLLHNTGDVENILCQSSENGEKWVKLNALPNVAIYTGNLQRRTLFNLYLQDNATQDDMIVESMTVKIEDGQEKITVQAVNYATEYWSGDPQEVSTGSFSTAFSDAFDKGQ